jgi:short-subunit dehydrogenase
MKRIIVVGASSGMGERVAQLFAENGWLVGVAARRIDRLQAFAAQYSDRVTTAAIDVTSSTAESDFMSLIDRVGGMDVLLYSAGCGWNNPSLDTAFDSRTVRTNVDGFTTIISAAYRYFRDNKCRGQIAAITSIAGTKGIGISATYSASKRYQNTFLQSIEQLANQQKVDVRITDIRPGFVDTDLLDTAKNKYPLLMPVERVSQKIYKAIIKRRRCIVINRRWAVIVALWRLIPDALWRKFKL